MHSNLRLAGILSCALLIAVAQARGQQPDRSAGSGDTPDVAGPLATDLSPELTPGAVAKAMRKVGDWELAHSREQFSQDWTFAALYRGLLAAGDTLHDQRYKDAMVATGTQFDWKPGSRETVADDQAVSYLYLALYRQSHDPKMLGPTKSEFDRLLALPDVCTEGCPAGHDQNTPTWWWCDALFMAPPVWAQLAGITGNRAYLDHLDKQWWATSALLYDPNEHLYSRDASFLNKHQANGKKIFWSRGNGWVIAGLALVLEQMPMNYPNRPKYAAQFREMAERLRSIQGDDGLWRPGLLDPNAYPLPEVSGSAFYVYAMAWGIRQGLLDRATFLPAVKKGWAGLLAHVYADGRLGSIQPIGAAPDQYKPQTSYVFGVGAFLMAGSEISELIEHKH
jgi:rhamnogalacturonyl hydrolase YesR